MIILFLKIKIFKKNFNLDSIISETNIRITTDYYMNKN